MGYKGIVDRDYLTDWEIGNIEHTYMNLRLLRYYSIENYVLHSDILQEYYKRKGKDFEYELYIYRLTECKNEVKDKIIYRVKELRSSYPFFRDKDHEYQFTSNMESGETIVEMVNNDVFRLFTKFYP